MQVLSLPLKTLVWEGMCSEHDYQAHLKRISDYLLIGEGIWWHQETDTGYLVFHDGDAEPEFPEEGPALRDFQTESLTSSHAYLK